MKHTESSTPDAWVACPAGELSRMVHQIRGERRRRVLSQTAAAAVVVLVVAVSAWQFFPGTDDFSYGQITCTEIEAGLQDYLAHRLSPEQAQHFRLHLDRCPRCKRLLEQMGGAGEGLVADASESYPGREHWGQANRLMLADGADVFHNPSWATRP